MVQPSPLAAAPPLAAAAVNAAVRDNKAPFFFARCYISTMPPRRRQSKAVGPFDLRTRKLPGGTETEAIATGIILAQTNLRGYSAGYNYAATVANQNILNDATKQQPFIIADVKTGILRSQNAPQLFTEFRQEMVETFTRAGESDITSDEFSKGDAWRRATGATRNAPLTGPFSAMGEHYVKLKDGVFLHHRHEKNIYPPSPQKAHPQFRIAY